MFYFDQIKLVYVHFEFYLLEKRSHSDPGGGDVPYRNSKLLNRMAWDKLEVHKVQHMCWRTSCTVMGDSQGRNISSNSLIGKICCFDTAEKNMFNAQWNNKEVKGTWNESPNTLGRLHCLNLPSPTSPVHPLLRLCLAKGSWHPAHDPCKCLWWSNLPGRALWLKSSFITSLTLIRLIYTMDMSEECLQYLWFVDS